MGKVIEYTSCREERERDTTKKSDGGKKVEKTFEKPLDKGGRTWYNIQAVAERGQRSLTNEQ